ncbi:hypothetical protein BHE74_00030254, partial [Ensete ventricosum]
KRSSSPVSVLDLDRTVGVGAVDIVSHIPGRAVPVAWRFFFGDSAVCVMNATGSMGLAVAVRPCCRLIAAQILPRCPHHHGRRISALSFFHKCSHGRRHFSRCPCPLPPRRSAAAWVRPAVAAARDGAAVSDPRRLSTSVGPGPVPGGDKDFGRIFVQGLAAVKPHVIDGVEQPPVVEGEKTKTEAVEEEEDRSEVAKGRLQSESQKEAWRLLKNAVVTYCGSPVGTLAAIDPAVELLNYDQVFIRDFVPSALAFLLKGEMEIVRNFLLHTLHLQVTRIKISWEKTVDCYSPGQGLMPASFKVRNVPQGINGAVEEFLDPDFGESAIGRVAPVDSGGHLTKISGVVCFLN